MNPREALAREAIRLHERYHRELIERFSVCPWAKAARADGRTRARVLVERSPSREEVQALLDAWAAEESVDVAFLIVPRFDAGVDAFSDFATSLGELARDVFLTAPFYPCATVDVGTVHFLRQTPDPTVQLVRRTRLEEIRAQDPPHYADIFELNLNDLEPGKRPRSVAASVFAHNEQMVCREGRAAIQAIVDELRADRERAYAKLLPLI